MAELIGISLMGSCVSFLCVQSDLVKFLLKSGAIGSLVDNEGDSAIHYVCLKDQAERTHVEALNLLLEQAANSSLQNKKGDTPLHIAARFVYGS